MHRRIAAMDNQKRVILQTVFAALGLAFTWRLYNTCQIYPLFPFQPKSAEWSYEWLMTTCGDFWTLSACLSLIVFSTEEHWLTGIIWVCLINLLGSPFACLWVITKLSAGKSMSLGGSSSSNPRGNGYNAVGPGAHELQRV